MVRVNPDDGRSQKVWLAKERGRGTDGEYPSLAALDYLLSNC